MASPDSVIAALAKPSLGVFARREALAAGLTHSQLRVRIARGQLLPVRRGVLMVAGSPSSDQSRLLAAQKQLGEQAVVSHLPAGTMHGLDGYEELPLQFTIARGTRARVKGVRLHFIPLNRRDVIKRGPFLVTRIERTLVDLCSVVTMDRVEQALESALFLGLTRLDRVVNELSSTPGRRHANVLRHIIAGRDPRQKPTESFLETRFWSLLKKSTLPRPERQWRVFDDVGFVGRLDLAYPDERVGLEVLGLKFHFQRLRQIRDAARHNRLETIGWRILYVTKDELDRHPDRVLEQLRTLLELARAN